MHSAEYLARDSHGHKPQQVVVQGVDVINYLVSYPNYAEEQGYEVHREGQGCF